MSVSKSVVIASLIVLLTALSILINLFYSGSVGYLSITSSDVSSGTLWTRLRSHLRSNPSTETVESRNIFRDFKPGPAAARIEPPILNRSAIQAENVALNDATVLHQECDLPDCLEGEAFPRFNVVRDRRNKNKTLVGMKSKGRLGNQMFQYAALYSVARTKGWTPYMKPEHFTILKTTFNDSLWIPSINPKLDNVSVINENIDADKMLERLGELPDEDTFFYGFYQSWKFFDEYADDIRRQFTFSSGVQKTVKSFFNKVVSGRLHKESTDIVKVGIHVRRTSMITEARIRSGVVPCPPSYFEHAMEYFKHKHHSVVFIVMSDAIDWCMENIKGNDVVYSQHDRTTDLAILSSCDHVITSLGTFSWWAGWLCPGTTVYYGVPPPNGTYMAMLFENNKWIPPRSSSNDWISLV